MYERIAALMPKHVTNAFRREFSYLDIHTEANKFVGFLILFSLGLSIGLSANLFYFFGIPAIPAFFFIYIIFWGVMYLWFSAAADNRARFVERVLPDALQLISSNIKTGLTTERALFLAARPEFGVLSEQLIEASRKILSGTRVETALGSIPEKIKSPVLKRTIFLLSRGISSGGQIAELLTQLSDDLREQNALKDEINANVSIYVLLIFFAAAFGAPLLFGISTFIADVLSSQTSAIPVISESQLASLPSTGVSTDAVRQFGGERETISGDFIIFFAQISLLMTSFFSAMIIGVINTGSEKGGLKMFPAILIISLVIFIVIRVVLGDMFSQLL